MNQQSNVTLPADAPDFVLTRIFAAPRALVYKCWMEPSHLARWWGPKPFTCPVCDVEPRVGGEFRLVMRAPDGSDYPMRGTFREIVPDVRIVKEDDVSEHSEEWHDMVDPARKGQGKRKIDLLTTVTFEDHPDGTMVTIITTFKTIAMRDSFARIGMKEGWSSSLEKLEELLDAVKGSAREIVMTRLIDAPREVVFRAFTDPDNLGKWWGPDGFTTSAHHMDLRVGGVWQFVMIGPDGKNYPNLSIYTEIRQPERIAYDHYAEEGGPLYFKAVIAFDEDGAKTKVTLRLVCETAEQREGMLAFGAVEGGWQTLGRLAGYLAKTPGKDFIISRVFDAPRDLVFKAFTEAERMRHWWGPKGFIVVKLEMDLRVGGICHYGLRAPDGAIMWGKFVYREIAAPSRIVFVNSFSDEQGGMARHPMSPTWPLEMLSTFLFEEVENGRTKLTITWSPHNSSEAERATFAAAHDGMNQGWGGTLDQLAAYLATA